MRYLVGLIAIDHTSNFCCLSQDSNVTALKEEHRNRRTETEVSRPMLNQLLLFNTVVKVYSRILD